MNHGRLPSSASASRWPCSAVMPTASWAHWSPRTILTVHSHCRTSAWGWFQDRDLGLIFTAETRWVSCRFELFFSFLYQFSLLFPLLSNKLINPRVANHISYDTATLNSKNQPTYIMSPSFHIETMKCYFAFFCTILVCVTQQRPENFYPPSSRGGSGKGSLWHKVKVNWGNIGSGVTLAHFTVRPVSKLNMVFYLLLLFLLFTGLIASSFCACSHFPFTYSHFRKICNVGW